MIFKKKSLYNIKKISVTDILIMLVITLLCLTCILPFVHVLSVSISSDRAVISHEVFLWPVELNFNAYIRVITSSVLMKQMWFTVILTITQTVLSLCVTSLCAYPLSRRYLPGRRGITIFIMITMYFSAGLIPTYMLFYDLKLLNTFWVLVLPGAFTAYNMLILRSYFMNAIPDSLEESAVLDGAGQFRIFMQIWLPLSKPVLATVTLWVAVGRWNGFGDAMFFTSDRSLQPIQLWLYNMILSPNPSESLEAQTGNLNTPEVLQNAVVMMATLPILLVYPFLQKYFVKGVTLGAVKG